MMRYPLARVAILISVLSYATASVAQLTGKAALEAKLTEKLNRILTEDEYVIDIKINAGNGQAVSPDRMLPGLQVLGAVAEDAGSGPMPIILEGKADILLILDKKVSKERARVAQDLVNRIVDSEGLKTLVKVSSQQKDINKIPEPEIPPPPPKDPTFLEQMIREKDFVSKALMVIWGAFVSLMAVYFVLRRVLMSGSKDDSKGGRDQQPMPMPVPMPAPASSEKKEKTKEELYSKDEAILGVINEIKNEAKEQPQKIARILSRWVAQSDEMARMSSLFLRNCDIKTVEAVCKSLHPSDLEKIIGHKIDDFEPFGPENQRTIERMRADLAVLASEHILKERPDPLRFLKMLSDDDIRNILEGEDTDTIALVATQVPAHRMQKLFDNTPPDVMSAVITKISTIKAASPKDFDQLKAQLAQKAEALAGNLFTDKDRVQSLTQIISTVSSPIAQCGLMDKLKTDNHMAYASVRPAIFLATDVRFLPGRCKSLLIQSVDADTFGIALSDFAMSFELFTEGLPPAYQSVFSDAQGRRYEPNLVINSWKKVSTALQELVSSGLISKTDLASAIRKADQPMAENDDNDSDSDNGQEELNGAA